MSSRKKSRKRRKKGHRRTSSDILSSGDADILKAILHSQHHKQDESQKQHSKGSLHSTIESIDHVFNTTNTCSCNRFIIYDILCVIIAFCQMLFYYYLIGQYAKNSSILFNISCTMLLLSRFIWSLYLSHYMKHKIIPYLTVYFIMLTDFVLPLFLLFKYCASDLYSKKSLNHSIRSQLFIVCIPMTIIQIVAMTLNNKLFVTSFISICIVIISITMEFVSITKHSLNLKIRIFHCLSFLLDIFKFFINIYVITSIFKYDSIIIRIFVYVVLIKTFIITPILAIIITTTKHWNTSYNAAYIPYRKCETSAHHIGCCLGLTLKYNVIIIEKFNQFVLNPFVYIFIHICSFFYIWIALEILCWSSFWFIFHSHYKNVFGIHWNKLKYILSFLFESINSFDYTIRLYCLHYILYDGYGWWQRKHYEHKIEKLLQKYINNTENINIEEKCDISQFTPSDKGFIDEINSNIRFMISHFLQHIMKIACFQYNEYKQTSKIQKYIFYGYFVLNMYSSLIFPLILFIYSFITKHELLLLFKLLCGYFCCLLILSYFMYEYYRYCHCYWHCNLINFQYPIKLELLGPFYEYIHTYYGRIEIIRTYFGSLSDIIIELLGLEASSKSIVRDGIKYAAEKGVYDKEFRNFPQCKQVVLNIQQQRKIYPNFNLYLFHYAK